MDVASAKAQGSLNPEAAGFMLILVPFSRYLCTVLKLYNLMQQPWSEFALTKMISFIRKGVRFCLMD